MADYVFYVEYWTREYLNQKFPDLKGKEGMNAPHFELSIGEVPSPEKKSLAQSPAFMDILMGVLLYLKKPESRRYTYQAKFADEASSQIARTCREGNHVLEGILAQHNDFIVPRELS